MDSMTEVGKTIRDQGSKVHMVVDSDNKCIFITPIEHHAHVIAALASVVGRNSYITRQYFVSTVVLTKGQENGQNISR